METISLDTAPARSQEGAIYVSSSSRWTFSDMTYILSQGVCQG